MFPGATFCLVFPRKQQCKSGSERSKQMFLSDFWPWKMSFPWMSKSFQDCRWERRSMHHSTCWSVIKTPVHECLSLPPSPPPPSVLFPSRLSGLWMTTASLPVLMARLCSIAQGSHESCTACEESCSSVRCVTAPSSAQCLIHYRNSFCSQKRFWQEVVNESLLDREL